MRRPSCTWLLSLGLTLAASGLAPDARADAESGFAFEWRAPEGCPPADAVEVEIEHLLGGPVREHARADLQGSNAFLCGGTVGILCATGQFCDLASNCGAISDATGICMPLGGVCTADYNPVCGCDGKTYSNDCARFSSGMLKASNGACPTVLDAGATACSAAYLAWLAPGGFAGTGPAVVVCGKGWVDTWTTVNSFSPEVPPSSATGTYTVTTTQTDDLFGRLALVDLTSLPHATTITAECYPTLYLRTCATCAATTLSYHVASQLVPEMERVWLWFDQLLGASAATNPRNYCNFHRL